MTDYAELTKRLIAKAGYVEAFPGATVHHKAVPDILKEAAAAISELTKERDALLITAAALGDLKPEAVLQHVRDSIATTNQPRSENAP